MVFDRHNTSMGSHRRAVGVFSNRRDAENALYELKASGFNMDHVSVIARDGDHDKGTSTKRIGNKADEGAGVGAASGGVVGGLTGLLVGLGTLAIPGVGPIMLAGAAATALATAAAGTAIGAASGGLLGGLVGLGIPEREAKMYSDRVHHGDYLVIVDGTDEEIRRAEAILNRQNGLHDWAVYDQPANTHHESAAVTSAAMPLEGSAALADAPITTGKRTETTAPVVDHTSTAWMETPATPAVDRTLADDEAVRLHEERLIVDKDRTKTGEVTIGKHIETETRQVSVPIEKERVIVERVTPTNTEAVGDDAFRAAEIHMEVYEEAPDIQKEAFVREEVIVHKEVVEETLAVEETLRREEIDVHTEGKAIVDRDLDQR